jgi:hypothetical protein
LDGEPIVFSTGQSPLLRNRFGERRHNFVKELASFPALALDDFEGPTDGLKVRIVDFMRRREIGRAHNGSRHCASDSALRRGAARRPGSVPALSHVGLAAPPAV